MAVSDASIADLEPLVGLQRSRLDELGAGVPLAARRLRGGGDFCGIESFL